MSKKKDEFSFFFCNAYGFPLLVRTRSYPRAKLSTRSFFFVRLRGSHVFRRKRSYLGRVVSIFYCVHFQNLFYVMCRFCKKKETVTIGLGQCADLRHWPVVRFRKRSVSGGIRSSIQHNNRPVCLQPPQQISPDPTVLAGFAQLLLFCNQIT